MSWQWNNLRKLDDWLATDPPADTRGAVLELMATWLEELDAGDQHHLESGGMASDARFSRQRAVGGQIIVAIVVAQFRTLYLTAIIDAEL